MLSSILLLAVPLVTGFTIPATLRRATCSASVVSCSSAADSTNTCCVNRPGGLFVQTQFWDSDPVTGPSNSWTIHGLWPDNCDGTYSSNCDSSREYSNIGSLLKSFGKSDLVAYMNTYMQSNSETPESFWEHEWGKHGTCVSTLEPSCYSSYSTGKEAADYFQTLVDLFKKLDTYTALSNAGITPSTSKTYTSAQIIAALTKVTGKTPIIQCNSGKFYQVYYGFHVNGPLTNANFEASNVAGTSSNCPSTGVKYLPKSGSGTSPSPTSATTTGAPAPTSTGSFSGKGTLTAIYNGGQDGCLIGAGTWYTTGTCGTYTATTSGSGFTLASSKGSCGVVSNAFTCGSGVTATVFTASGGLLAYNGQTSFYASTVPSGTVQSTIYTSSKSYSLTLKWVAA